MKRRNFVGGLAAASVAACSKDDGNCEVAADRSAEKFEWSCVTSWPPKYPGMGMGVESLATRIDAASGGRLKINVYGGGELVPAFEVFDAVGNESPVWGDVTGDGKKEILCSIDGRFGFVSVPVLTMGTAT